MSDEKQNETEQIIAETPAESKKSRAPRKTAPAKKKGTKKTDDTATPKPVKKIRKVTRENLFHLTTFERLVRESINIVAGQKNNIRIEKNVTKTISDMCADKLIKLISLAKNASDYKGVESIDSGAIHVALKILMAVKKTPSLAF